MVARFIGEKHEAEREWLRAEGCPLFAWGNAGAKRSPMLAARGLLSVGAASVLRVQQVCAGYHNHND